MENNTTPTLSDSDVIHQLMTHLISYQTDIAERNTYIDKRDRYLYGDGLFETISIPDGFDQTLYNFLRPITTIHASQFMQEGFAMYSRYDKVGNAMLDPEKDAQQIQANKLANMDSETKAFGKKKAIEAIIRDNGGYKIFIDGAQSGSDYGSTLYQMWFDESEKKIRIQLLESIQNWFPIWEDNNFRSRIGDAYVIQTSPLIANQKYQDKIPEGGFPTTIGGDPLTTIQGLSTTLTNTAGETVSGSSTRRPMVTVINYTGYLPNIKEVGGEYVTCKDGDETMISFKAVGNVIVNKITNDAHMPRFYYIPNSVVPRRPYGESDLTESALQLNATIIQTKSSQLTRADKVLFPIVQMIGWENGSMPPRNQREMTLVPMQQGQQIVPVHFDTQSIEYDRIIADLTKDLLQVSRVPRVLFDDPSVSLNSNQALLTSLRPMIDVVTRKQKNWEPVLTQMFDDALELAALHVPAIAELLGANDDSTGDNYLYVRWPSVMRKDDPAHQVMLMNDLNAGIKSIDTIMEERGIIDVEEEINRIASAMDDPTRAAIMGKALGQLAHYTIQKAAGIPAWGYNVPKVTLKGELPPQEVGNMAHTYGWDQGPYGAAIGPTGREGVAANDNWLNGGLINGNAFDGGTAAGLPPGGINPSQGQPTMTPDQNQPSPQPMSQPGSGPTSAGAAGSASMAHQRAGRR